MKPGTYVGVASCTNSGCHGSTQPLHASRVLQNEYYTWLNTDRHAHAYNVLFNARSTRIAHNMHLKRAAYQEDVCLNCHTMNVPASLISGHVDREDGIQCEACHGPAGGWRNEHSQPGWEHAQSVARGMIDVRRVTTRGSLCLACHMGDRDRDVDHELIASGHPMLVFELDNYTETMPPHWNAHPDTHGVRAWATGQVVAFRDSLANLARHARGDKWPEFSDMSCFDCHHALPSGVVRQERGWNGRAGMPAFSRQHWSVLRQIIGSTAPEVRDQLDANVDRISALVSSMKDGAAVASAADESRQIVDGVIGRIDSARWDAAQVRALMLAIADDRDVATRADIRSAEQIALSLQSLAASMTRSDRRLLRSPMTKAIDDLFNELRARDDFDAARFSQKLAAVRATL